MHVAIPAVPHALSIHTALSIVSPRMLCQHSRRGFLPIDSPSMLWSHVHRCPLSCLSLSSCGQNHIPTVSCCSLREKLARALALLRTYQNRLRTAHAFASAAPPPRPPPPPEAQSAADAPLAGAPPALPAPHVGQAEVQSVPARQCPACCQRMAVAPGRGNAEGGAANRLGVDGNPAVAPAPPDALADLAASLLAWQLRRGGATLEGLGSASRGSGSALEPAAASMSAAPQSEAGGASQGRALRFDPTSGRSGAFVYEYAGGPAGSHEPSVPAEAACAPARADASLASSRAGQHIDDGTASWDQSARQAAAPAAPVFGDAGAWDAAQESGAGAAAADRHGGSSGGGARCAVVGGAGGAVLRWAGGLAAGPLAGRAPTAAASDAAVAGQRPEPGERLLLAADEHAPWRQRAHAAHAHAGPEAADRAEAVRLQPGELAKMSAPAR